MVMRWKILELANKCSSLDELLSQLKDYPEYDVPADGGIELLKSYSDILPSNIRQDLLTRE